MLNFFSYCGNDMEAIPAELIVLIVDHNNGNYGALARVSRHFNGALRGLKWQYFRKLLRQSSGSNGAYYWLMPNWLLHGKYSDRTMNVAGYWAYADYETYAKYRFGVRHGRCKTY